MSSGPRAWLLVAVWLASTAAIASAPTEILAPPEPVSPDGFVVTVLGGGLLTAQGGTVTARSGEPGRFDVHPDESARELTLSSAGSSRRLTVGPPAARVALALTPPAPVKGRDVDAVLDVRVTRADGSADADSAPPVIRSNVGTVEGVERTGPGTYRGRYVLPKTRYPEVAIIVAWAAWPHPQSVHGATGSMRVPLASAVEVPGHTEAFADMQLAIAGTTFGPVKAGADGSFRLPVVVPPGYGLATGTAVDRLGNRKTVKFDLHLPHTDQLACVANPVRLPADGVARARVLCALSDVYGGVTRGAKVQLSAPRGALSAARDLGDGLFEWSWTAPTAIGDGHVPLQASWRQSGFDSKEELQVELTAAPVRRLEWVTAPPDYVPAGGQWSARVRAWEEGGRPAAGARVRVRGEAEWVETDARGEATVRWAVPAGAPRGARTVTVEAVGPFGVEPARLWVWQEAGEPVASVTDLAGRPVPGQSLVLEGRGLVTGADGTAPLGQLPGHDALLVHGQWHGLQELVRVRGAALLPGVVAPGRAALTRSVEVGPPSPVVVRIEARGDAWAWWVESSAGELLADREVVVRRGGEATSARSGAGPTLAPGTEALSVVDVVSHVAAAVGARP